MPRHSRHVGRPEPGWLDEQCEVTKVERAVGRDREWGWVRPLQLVFIEAVPKASHDVQRRHKPEWSQNHSVLPVHPAGSDGIDQNVKYVFVMVGGRLLLSSGW